MPRPPFYGIQVICSNLCRGLCSVFIKVFYTRSDTCVMRSANFRWVGQGGGTGGGIALSLQHYHHDHHLFILSLLSLLLRRLLLLPLLDISVLRFPHFCHSLLCDSSPLQLPLHYIIVTITNLLSGITLVVDVGPPASPL